MRAAGVNNGEFVSGVYTIEILTSKTFKINNNKIVNSVAWLINKPTK